MEGNSGGGQSKAAREEEFQPEIEDTHEPSFPHREMRAHLNIDETAAEANGGVEHVLIHDHPMIGATESGHRACRYDIEVDLEVGTFYNTHLFLKYFLMNTFSNSFIFCLGKNASREIVFEEQS